MAKRHKAKAGRKNPLTIGATEGASHRPTYGFADSDKAFVMNRIRDLIKAGCAEMNLLDGGVVELRLMTGEVYCMGHEVVTRLR